ncbi:MAG: dTDP-4-dehydrorhamnose reductase [Candidatus Erwinia impunctatus]|nr:dTDP-4-dehydrorhamnose reductase [Culicoides impunctatus]
MRILVTGGNGQLGHCFTDTLPDNWPLVSLDHKQLDIADWPGVQQIVTALNVDFIFNPAAYTLIDKAEEEIITAQAVNVLGPANLAIIAESLNILLIHISTDYVFSGMEEGVSLCENSPTQPLNVYGQTKQLGEQDVLATCSRSVVLRISWLFSEYGSSFVHTMLKLGKTRKSLAIINDQFSSPTYVGDLAKCIITIIDQRVNEPMLYYFCGDKTVSWYEFATRIFSLAKVFEDSYIFMFLSPISSEKYKCVAKKPKHAILNCEKIYCERGVCNSNRRMSLDKVVPEIIFQMNN